MSLLHLTKIICTEKLCATEPHPKPADDSGHQFWHPFGYDLVTALSMCTDPAWTLLNSGSQRCCQWVSYSKIFIFQSNTIYICSLPLALICLLITRLVFVFQMPKRLCWFVQEICLDGAHKVYLLTFDIFTGWETKWKIQVFKLHRWHLRQSTSFQN